MEFLSVALPTIFPDFISELLTISVKLVQPITGPSGKHGPNGKPVSLQRDQNGSDLKLVEDGPRWWPPSCNYPLWSHEKSIEIYFYLSLFTSNLGPSYLVLVCHKMYLWLSVRIQAPATLPDSSCATNRVNRLSHISNWKLDAAQPGFFFVWNDETWLVGGGWPNMT